MATELEIARRAVERGLLEAEQLQSCLTERRRLLQDGLDLSLRDLLFDGGLLDAERWAGLVEPAPPLAETRDDAASELPQPGPSPEQEVLGDYRVVRELGRGAMGVVYEAVQQKLGRHVALKVLPATQALQGVARERFLREARATASLRHPGIVQIFDIEEERGVHFFAMELLNGRSLRRVLEEDGALPPSEVARIGVAAAEALAYAHQRGVIHRDVKPDNIIMREDGEVVLTDFGLALQESEFALTQAGTIVGTPLYMAPEQARGSKELDARIDVYALAVTLYELVSGTAPFREAQDTAVLFEWIAEREPTSLRRVAPQVPQPLEAIIEVGLAKDPAGRYATAEDMAADLQRFRRGEPILAKPPGAFARTWRAIRRRSRLASAMAVGLLLLVTGVRVASAISRRWQAEGLVLESLRLADRGQTDGAEAALDQALELAPDYAEAHVQRGELLLTRGDEAGAKASFDLALESEPRHVGALLARGRLRLQTGEVAEARADLDGARDAAQPDDERPRLALGLLLAQVGEVEQSLTELRKGLELARAARNTHSQLYRESVPVLGGLELSHGSPEAAVVELEEAVRLFPNDPQPQVSLGRALFSGGNVRAALESFSAALRRDPTSLEAREGRGKCHRALGQLSEAYRDLEASKSRPSARLALGLLLFETIGLGPQTSDRLAFDDQASRAELEAAADSPELTPGERASAHTALGWLELHGERPYRTKALEAFQHALKQDPAAVGARLARGMVFLAWNRLDEARAELEPLRAPGPARYPALVTLARVAEARGEPSVARGLLDEAVEEDPTRTAAYASRYLLKLAADEPAKDDRERALTLPPIDSPQPFDALSDPLRLAELATANGLQALSNAMRQPGSLPWRRSVSAATAWLNRALVYDPHSPGAAARLGSVLYLDGRFPSSLEAFTRARGLDPLLAEVDILRAVTLRDVLVEQGGPEAARRLLLAAFERPQLEVRVQNIIQVELAKCSIALDRLDEALEHLEFAAQLGVERWVVTSLRARILTTQGDPEAARAVKVAGDAFYTGARDTQRSAIYTRAGLELLDRDRNVGGRHLLTRAIEYDPLNAEAWRQRSQVFLRGRPSELALGLVDAFISCEIDPRANTVRFLELEARLNRYMRLLPLIDEGIESALSTTPELPAASFCRGFLCFYQGRPEEAEGHFSRGLELSQGRSYLSLCYRGATRMRLGRLADAHADLDAAELILPGGPVSRFWRACVLAEEGKVDACLTLLEESQRKTQVEPSHLRDTPELAALLEHPRMKRMLAALETD